MVYVATHNDKETEESETDSGMDHLVSTMQVEKLDVAETGSITVLEEKHEDEKDTFANDLTQDYYVPYNKQEADSSSQGTKTGEDDSIQSTQNARRELQSLRN